ncbi:MAG: 16S rRNA (adenine(1518)-N(6)/adenine(1519)-N(6))-dimethyltransferase RsmA [Clostridia bacterium]|nr:16S rRNA (adenine(1518)-N(6)/adenine(1519)-N(6))-dimethyltransferase RsmA [Clostridia bacterium]
MKNLASVSVIKDILSESGFKFSKSLGQNFLIDENVLKKIVDGAHIEPDNGVIEIGPGFGTLTQRLCMAAGKVVCIEIDKSAIPILENNLSGFNNLKIINADVLKTDLKKIISEEFADSTVKIAANLPYYITTPIIMSILEARLPVESLTVMIQKEVAERISAKPSTKEYGALSVAVNYYSEPEMITVVPPSAFIPQPKVSSAVVKLKLRENPPVDVTDEKGYFKIVKAAFAQRRKTLLNALSNSPAIPLEKDGVSRILQGCGIDGNRRGETLSLEEFADIANVVFPGK